MSTLNRRPSLLATGSLALLLVLAFPLGMHLASALDCEGKSYGYPGCPTRSAPGTSSSSGPNFCGNAILDPGEDCDKGRFNGKTDCGLDCRFLYCGDGVISKDIGEECEPETDEVYVKDKSGNLTTEIIFTGNAQCGWYCQPPSCSETGKCTGGCKHKYIGECSASGSLVESGSGANSVQNSSHASTASAGAKPGICGNAAVEQGEECDDGNKNTVDACTNECTLPSCGDAIVQKGEECDDGNGQTADECTNSCTQSRCGDGIRQADEECDAGSDNDDKGQNSCRTSCTLAHCGDGVVDRGEQCDAGVRNSNTVANACRTICRIAWCGDGVKDSVEDCDDGNRSETDACTSACKLPVCGDGIVRPGEECDWGTRNSDSTPNSCRITCRLPRCGDKIVDTGEQCDGGRSCAADCKPVVASVRSSSSSAHAAAGVAAARTPGAAVPAILGVSGMLIAGSFFLFRKKLGKFFGRLGKIKDLDDIPLDQIEMPWHKW